MTAECDGELVKAGVALPAVGVPATHLVRAHRGGPPEGGADGAGQGGGVPATTTTRSATPTSPRRNCVTSTVPTTSRWSTSSATRRGAGPRRDGDLKKGGAPQLEPVWNGLELGAVAGGTSSRALKGDEQRLRHLCPLRRAAPSGLGLRPRRADRGIQLRLNYGYPTQMFVTLQKRRFWANQSGTHGYCGVARER